MSLHMKYVLVEKFDVYMLRNVNWKTRMDIPKYENVSYALKIYFKTTRTENSLNLGKGIHPSLNVYCLLKNKVSCFLSWKTFKSLGKQ